ncbi:MAG: 50S ribosomal protein L23 [Candidatus Geothermincolia bacterium]
MKHAHDVILSPVVSEKSYGEMDRSKYTFLVHPDARKTEIRQAVQEIFKVRVAAVNTLKVRAKPKRHGWSRGKTPERKKAIVTLAPGNTIEFFEGTMGKG